MPTLTVPAEIEALETIASWVGDAVGAAGLSPMAGYQLRLAVDEIATNIITHGYRRPGGTITLRSELSPALLRVVIEDEGSPFDPLGLRPVTEEDLARPLEERPIGGLGIFLVLKSVDFFRYEYAGGCNRNILEMKRPATSITS